MPVRSGEEKEAIDHSRFADVGAGRAGRDVRYQGGAGGGTIAPPQLLTVDAVVGNEVQEPVHRGEKGGAFREGRIEGIGAGPRVDVLDQSGARGRAVAL